MGFVRVLAEGGIRSMSSVRVHSRTPKLVLLVATAICAATMLVAAPTAPAAAPPRASVTTTINGVTYQLTNLAASTVNGALQITGTATNLATGQSGAFNLVGTLTNATTGASCSILHLDIQPISLNLLGLQVTTSEIVLDITAQPGPGNLLGNLLCSVAGLLDNNSGGGLTAILNRLFTSLGI